MPEDPTSRALFLMMLAAALCMVGMLTIWLLAIVWRRYNRRLDASRRMPDTMPDVWQTGGQRLASDVQHDIDLERRRHEDDDEFNTFDEDDRY